MPYAIFDGDEQISRAYPTSDEVWMHAKEAGLVIDKIPEESGPRHVLDQSYEIRACDPGDEDPKANGRAAEEAADEFPFLKR